MKSIVILGSTGSIGTQTLDVIRHAPEAFKVAGLAVNTSVEALRAQVREFQPAAAVICDVQSYRQAAADWPYPHTRLLAGMHGLLELARLPEADAVVTAMVGMIGLAPTVEAIKAGKDIALANKETLVCGGQLIMGLARETGSRILPVDSEHGAIFQCLRGRDAGEVEKLWLTASGGPFRGFTAKQLSQATKEQALRHPSWSMGPKITVDSATMVNKGLEIIEARWLFGMSEDKIGVVVHPQSLVHSLVEFADGSQLAQLATPDMRLPIQAALYYPETGGRLIRPLKLAEVGRLLFEAPDEDTFRSLKLARSALRTGGLYPAIFNAANEMAVQAFLHDEIGFTDIFAVLEKALEWADRRNAPKNEYTLEEITDWEKALREEKIWA